MRISEVIHKLKKFQKRNGDLEVEAIHADRFYYYKVMEVTMPQDRQVVVIATLPVEWAEMNDALNAIGSKENNDQEREEVVREESVHLDSDEDRAREA